MSDEELEKRLDAIRNELVAIRNTNGVIFLMILCMFMAFAFHGCDFK
jgi:hypothetical protein